MKTHKFLIELTQEDINELYYRYRLYTGKKNRVPVVTALKYVFFDLMPECVEDEEVGPLELPALNWMNKVSALKD